MNAVTEIKADHKTIAMALAAAQTKMGKALKSPNNPHFKSKYADLASVVDACMPALNECGIAVIQPTTDDGNAAAKAAPKADARTVTPDQFVKLRDKMESAGADENQFLAHYKAQSLQQFPLNSFADAMSQLEKKIAAPAPKENADLDGDEIPKHEDA